MRCATAGCLLSSIVLVLFCPVLWATKGARLGKDLGLEHFRDAVTPSDVMPVGKAAVPEFLSKWTVTSKT